MSINVTNTNIGCYSGCLTSSAILVTGASEDCHDGSIMQEFLLKMGALVLLALISSVCYHYSGWIHNKWCVVVEWWRLLLKVEGSVSQPTVTGNTVIKPDFNSNSNDNDTTSNTDSKADTDSSNNNNSILFITIAKFMFVLFITFYTNNWWSKGSPNNSNAIVESCSNKHPNNCNSYCNDVTIMVLNMTDDDTYLDFGSTPAEIFITPHQSTSSYCIAELYGSCAYDYWMVFKLVPLLMHMLISCLQLYFWWLVGDFNPQRKQYDTILHYIYPDIYSSVTNTTSKLLISSTSTSTSSTPAPPVQHPHNPQYRELFMVLERPEHTYCNIFSFLEIIIAIYVWAELG